MPLEAYLKKFDASQIHLVYQEKLLSSGNEELNDITEFLDVSEYSFLQSEKLFNHRSALGWDRMSSKDAIENNRKEIENEELLIDFYRPSLQRFYDMVKENGFSPPPNAWIEKYNLE